MFNGLLLAVHWDAAFNSDLVSFEDNGGALVKQGLSPEATSLLMPDDVRLIPLDAPHRRQLALHRTHFGSGL